MSTFEQVRHYLEEIWAEELAEEDREQAEADAAVQAARDTAARLMREITDTEAELEHLRVEQAELPRLLAEADLRGDEQAEGAVRRRYAEIEGSLPALTERLADLRVELRDLTGGDADRFLRRVEREHLGPLGPAHLKAQERRLREWNALRELLEEVRPGRPRTARERIRDEERIAKQQQADAEARRMAISNANFAEEQERQAAVTLAQVIAQNPHLLQSPEGPGFKAQLEKFGLLDKVLKGKGTSGDDLAAHIQRLEDSAAATGPIAG